jgi:uncharacterized protein YjbI with pentapeptide repeats
LSEKLGYVPSPISTSNWGARFEHLVGAIYLAEMLVGDIPYGLKEGKVSKVKFQTLFAGDKLDDIAVYTENPKLKLSLQIKSNLNFRKTDKDFLNVIKACWETRSGKSFDPRYERYGIGLGFYSQDLDTNLKVVIDLAKRSESPDEFERKMKLPGYSSQPKREFVDIFKEAITKAKGSTATAEDLRNFFRNFVILYFDVKDEGKDRTYHINALRNLVSNGSHQEAILLFDQLSTVAASFAASAGTLTKDTLKEEIPTGVLRTDDHSLTFDKTSYTKNLHEYLKFVKDLRNSKHRIDKRSLHEYYVQSKAIQQEIDKWDDSKSNSGTKWNIDDFLQGNEWSIVVAADFGIGKTSMMKMIASDLAISYLESDDGYLPIFSSLKLKLRNVYNSENLDFVLSNVVAPRYISKVTKILLILDGLDEYGESLSGLQNRLDSLRESYPEMKVIITTRMNAGYPRELGLTKFIKLLPFTESQIDRFFRKYGADLTFKELEGFGLKEEESVKPLFCWMMGFIAVSKGTKLEANDSQDPHVRRSLIYRQFIHSILRGKFRDEAQQSFNDFVTKYVGEKKILRKISALRQKHRGELTEDVLWSEMPAFNISSWEKDIDPILTSYFTQRTDGLKYMVDFIHESFKEYLLAEYYLESIIENKVHRLYVGNPSSETIEFLDGLLQLFKENRASTGLDEDDQLFLKSFMHYDGEKRIDFVSYTSLCTKLTEFAQDLLYNQIFVASQNTSSIEELWTIFDPGEESRFHWFHRWMAIIILNRLGIEIDRQDFHEMARSSSWHIPASMKYLRGIDLSGANLDNTDFSEAILVRSNLSRTSLIGTRLDSVHLSNARLNESILIKSNLQLADLTDCKLLKANLSYALLSNSLLKGANLTGALLDNANFGVKMLMKDGIIKEEDCSYMVDLRESTLTDIKVRNTVLSLLDLSKLNLTGADFQMSTLVKVNLSNAILFKSNLSGARIFRCDLSGQTDLSFSQLQTTQIISSDLSLANLSNCSLIGAHLDTVNLEYADLRGANLRGAYLGRIKTEGIKVDNRTKVHGVVLHSRQQFNRLDRKLKELISHQNLGLNYEKRSDFSKTLNINIDSGPRVRGS